MLVDLEKLITTNKLRKSGVIQIGAHHGEEIPTLLKMGFKDILCFEPCRKNFEVLYQKWGQAALCSNLACGDKVERKHLHIETKNRGQSNSLLEPKLHLEQYPTIKFEQKVEVNVIPLELFLIMLNSIAKKPLLYNVLLLDVQGYELKVLVGAQSYIDNFDIIVTEVNRAELYANCPHINEIDSYLQTKNFIRVYTNWAGGTWGDAVYLRQ